MKTLTFNGLLSHTGRYVSQAELKFFHAPPITTAFIIGVFCLLPVKPAIITGLLGLYCGLMLLLAVRNGASAVSWKEARTRFSVVFATLLTSVMVLKGFGNIPAPDMARFALIIMIYIFGVFFMAYMLSAEFRGPRPKRRFTSKTDQAIICVLTVIGLASLYYLNRQTLWLTGIIESVLFVS